MTIFQLIFAVLMALCAVCLLYYLFKATRYMRHHTDEFGWPAVPRDNEERDDDIEDVPIENEQS